jgi:hypothetical protein
MNKILTVFHDFYEIQIDGLSTIVWVYENSHDPESMRIPRP